MAGKTSADVSKRARRDQVDPSSGNTPSGGFVDAFRGMTNFIGGPGSVEDVSTTGPFGYEDEYVTESVPREALQTMLVPPDWRWASGSAERAGTKTYTRKLTDDDWRKKIFSDLGWNEPTQEDSDRAKERARQTDIGKRLESNEHPVFDGTISDWRDLTRAVSDDYPNYDEGDLYFEYDKHVPDFDISQRLVNGDYSEKDLRDLSQAMFGLAGMGELPMSPSRAWNDMWEDELKEYKYGDTDTGWYMDHPYDAAENLSGYERALAKLQYELDKAKDSWNRSRSDWGIWPDIEHLRWERERENRRKEEMRGLAREWNREREFVPFEEWDRRRKERMYDEDIPF